MMSSVIGGAMLPHAPQFFTMPDTEDAANVEHVRTIAAEIGRRLRALQPDLWIIFSNDHAEQFFHQAAPPFTIHVGGEATGEFAGRKFHWKVPSEIGFELVRGLYRQNFDPAFSSTAKIDYAIGIPLTHIGHTGPILPIYVNAYLPPQPTMERCYAFGEAVARTVTAMGLKTVILSSGGMSHFPGTERYGNPELAWDRRVLEKLAAGNLKSLIGYDEASSTRPEHRAARQPARPARWGNGCPTSCPWIRAGITTMLRWPGSIRLPARRPRIIPRSSPNWWRSHPRCTGSPMTRNGAPNTWPMRAPMRISSRCRPTSAKR